MTIDKNRCVLLVEDEVLVAMVAVDALDELGFRVLEAGSAGQALQLAADNKGLLDLALVDLGLPDRPGEELVGELRSLYPLLPIIVASGKGSGSVDPKVLALQNLIILPKPYDFEDLRAAIERAGGHAEA